MIRMTENLVKMTGLWQQTVMADAARAGGQG
jgi:hypothetical protein